ncbi:hypothetical protein [Catenulispora rubra]|uniref:hypothetical protein n=1 Tax=Catenulispora rubra TaxID=280293 RepID=UPI00189224CA|nr:hypothetical protein [Catenulispora rubra]
MYPDLCGTAADVDTDTGGGGTFAEDVPPTVTGDRDAIDDPAELVDAELAAPLLDRPGAEAVAEGFAATLVTDELTMMVDVSDTTDVTLTSEVETAPDALDVACVAPTTAAVDDLPCESG